ncbi:coiled-coil domain-containing protein 97 [Quillaja saponaria]|uniref:Coiled-coil domain-containing protein 97 n=1 Tax=Quillaja saponaria TaxID=32244 RepID=A0AAD7PF52_QUISA|nr:coiled-coil domain-containing protein 97 [Quillaja saponaria]
MKEKRLSGPLSGEAMEKISERLSSLENLYFPQALQSNATYPFQRKAIFLDLLSRYTELFLERYGSQLTCNELSEFDMLEDDYEISWHLKHLRSLMSPTSEELRTKSVTVKNRRRAYLDKLISDGQYFSEDAMRDREPCLHHEYIGKFQDLSGRGMARPGERWSETLLRRSEEAILVTKIRREQQRLGVAERDWIGNDRNQEEEEDGETKQGSGNAHSAVTHLKHSDETVGTPSNPERDNEVATLSSEELQDWMDQFTYIMQQKFLVGEDHKHFD